MQELPIGKRTEVQTAVAQGLAGGVPSEGGVQDIEKEEEKLAACGSDEALVGVSP